MRVYGDDSSDFENQVFIYELDNWDGSLTNIDIQTDKKYVKFENHVFYQFQIEDYSDVLEQVDSRDLAVRNPSPVLLDKYSDVVEFVNQLAVTGSEFLPNRYMMYYDQVLPVSFQQYAPTFLRKSVAELPTISLFDFSLISRLPLPNTNITIGLDILGDGGNWFPLVTNIGNINPIGKTLVELKQFDPSNSLVLPKGKNVLRANLKADQKVKLSVVALLS